MKVIASMVAFYDIDVYCIQYNDVIITGLTKYNDDIINSKKYVALYIKGTASRDGD
jgi:hypothetical protein